MGCTEGSEVPCSAPTRVLDATGCSRRVLPMVPFWVLLCSMEPCQAQQFTLQVKSNQKMCSSRMPSAFLLAGAQPMGQAQAGGRKETPNCRSCGPEVLRDDSLCRPAPIALHHLLSQNPGGSSPRAHVPYAGGNHCLT